MKTKLLVTFAVLVLTACPTTPKPHYVPAKDSNLLGAMCAHLKVLGCEEGQDVYDSDNPGPAGVPNTTCEAEYIKIQSNGTYLNPRCLLKVTSCGEIEEARKRTCE